MSENRDGDSLQPLVSVVLPVHNGSRWAARAIRSVLAEPEVAELIVVDDGSTDASVEVVAAAALADPRVRIVTHDRQRGVAAARNTSVDLARSPFLGFIDQDDAWASGRTARMLADWSSFGDPCVVVGRQVFELEAGLDRPAWLRPEWLEGPLPAYVFGGILLTKDTFLAVGRLDESLRLGADDVDWFGKARRGGVRQVDHEGTVLIRTVHDANGSANPVAQAEILAVIRRRIEDMR